jgi:glycosyltransferase involved in cell wall biosynthesis
VTTPFFSIVLPTRNRVSLAEQVIRNVLAQNFEDFELLVVDNGSDDSACRMAQAISDTRIRVLRTGGLSMHDNWQAGFDQACGQYVIMIEDKLFLVADALENCAKIHDATGTSLLTWTNAACDGPNCPSLAPIGIPTTETIKASLIIGFGLESKIDYYQKCAPRALNMSVRRSFALEVQKRVGRLFVAMAPDYSSGAFLLPFCEDFVHCHQTLTRPLRGGPSTGTAVGRRTAEADAFLNGLGMSRAELMQHVPVKIPFLSNLIVADLLRFWRRAGLDDRIWPLDPHGYFMMLLSELILAREHGTYSSTEHREVLSSFHTQPVLVRIAFIFYAVKRFIKGWPDRKARIRVNFPKFYQALRDLTRVPNHEKSI